jgi:hypothetical protein
MATIYFKHHSAGLINQTMSVETAFALAFLEKAKLHIYNTKNNKKNPIAISGIIPEERQKLYIGSRNPSIFDLLNLPENIDFVLDESKNIEEKYVKDIQTYSNLLNYYYKYKNSYEDEGEDENSFADGRFQLLIKSNENVHLHTYTFPLYSRFFYNRPIALDKFLFELSFKEPYQILAKLIADKIGSFKGLHFRLTDHARNYEYSKITLDYVNKSFSNNDTPLIISTDDKDTVKNLFNDKCIFIDEIIQEYFADEFMNLPFHNEAVFGMICLLVMGYSEEFIGTPGSTFSGYIHRLRVLKDSQQPMNYLPSGRINNLKYTGKPYSWNDNNMNTETKSWCREWPECKLRI